MYAIRPISAGAEVRSTAAYTVLMFTFVKIFITYGELPNTRLLLRYGFVEENNDFDYVQVRSPLLLLLSKIMETSFAYSFVSHVIRFIPRRFLMC